MKNPFSKLFGFKNEHPNPASTVGVGGYRKSGGYVYDEYLPELRGLRGRRKYREMADTDPTIGAMVFGLSAILRASEWRFEPSEADTDGKYAKWAEKTYFEMPGITWDQVIESALGFMVQGFAIQEMVTMRDPVDGTIRLAKLAPRAQETILRWETDRTGEIYGAWQTPTEGGGDIYLPNEKIIHYKTAYADGNPEGRSMLRNCYQPYHLSQAIVISETIGVERDLTGLPVMKAPNAWLDAGNNRQVAERIARDVRINDQSGLVLPSDPWTDADGGATDLPKFDFMLLSTDGSAKVDTDKIIKRHSANMARCWLADFIVIGTDGKGSLALSSDKSSMFIRAAEGVIENIAQTIDRQATPRLWAYNNFPPEMMPKARPGSLSPTDLQVLGDYVAKLAGAGVFLNDEDTEDYLRDQGGLPPVPADRPDPIEYPEDTTDPEDPKQNEDGGSTKG